MQRTSFIRIVLIVSLILPAARLSAHHAFSAEFDANRPFKIEGKLARVDWINPHVWFHVDVENPDGTVQRWMVESAGPGVLVRRGFARSEDTKPGTKIVVTGYLSKGLPNRGAARLITYPNGRQLFAGSTGTENLAQ